MPLARPRPAPSPLPSPAGHPRLVLGLQAVRAAIRAQRDRLGAVWLESEDAPRLASVARFARDQGVPEVRVVGRSLLDRAAAGVVHQGVLAWAHELELSALDPLLGDPALLGLALDRLQDPQNFGAVLRSAVGLGASCVLWGEHASAPLGPATLRAAAGAAEFARLCRVASLPAALGQAAEHGAQVVGLDAAAPVELRQVDLRRPTILLIGSEHRGMTPAARRACTVLARLVAPGAVESLNASVAAALSLYEAYSQRNSNR